MSFTEDESKMALQYAVNGAMFMYRASIKLSNEILNCGPASNGLPEFVKIMLIKRDWINIDSGMVSKYCKKNLDSRNSYIFDNGDIKVIPEKLII
jgi:hypothetical protein